MTSRIEFEGEHWDVDLTNAQSLAEAMIFKANHIKTKAEPELFQATADCLRSLWGFVRQKKSREAHWMVIDDHGVDVLQCSKCGYFDSEMNGSNFCPFCGRLMVEPDWLEGNDNA